MRAGSPLIELVRVVSDQSGRAVEHLHALYRPDRYAFEMDLVRSGAAGANAWSPVVRKTPRKSARATHGVRARNLNAREAGKSDAATLTKRENAMSEQRMPFSRRRFLATTALGAAAAASGSLAMPSVLRAQGAGVKLGLLHPVTGALSYSGQQGRIGATMAVDEINAAGGIKALGGAKIDPVLGDAQSTPDGGTAEVEKMNSAEVSCIVGGYAVLDLSRRQPGRRALRPALRRRRRRRRLHRHARAQEHVPLQPRLRRHRQDRARQSDDDQRSGRQAGEDGDDRPRGFAVRLRPRQAPERAVAAEGFRDFGDDPAPDADARLRQCRAQDQGAEPRPRHSRPTTTTNMSCSPAPCRSSTCGRRASIRCSAAPLRPTSSSRIFPTPPSTSWIAIIGSIRRAPRRRS